MKLDKFMSLPLEARRKVKLRTITRGSYNKRRPKLTQEEMLTYLKERDIHSVRQLRARRQADEPTVYDVRKMFDDSWSAAMESCWGKPSPFTCPKNDAAYILKCIVSFNLWRRDEFQKAHVRRPEVIPSIYHALRLFGGSWDKVIWAGRLTTVKGCLELWLRLRRRLGRNPSMAELDVAGIDMAPLRKIYTRLADLRDYLNRLGKIADRKEKEAAERNISDVSQAVPGVGEPGFADSHSLPQAPASSS